MNLLTFLSPSLLPPWSVGTPCQVADLELLLSGNIASHLEFVLPLITTRGSRLGRAPSHLLPACAGGGGQAGTGTARGWAGAGEMEPSFRKRQVFIRSSQHAQKGRDQKEQSLGGHRHPLWTRNSAAHPFRNWRLVIRCWKVAEMGWRAI